MYYSFEEKRFWCSRAKKEIEYSIDRVYPASIDAWKKKAKKDPYFYDFHPSGLPDIPSMNQVSIATTALYEIAWSPESFCSHLKREETIMFVREYADTFLKFADFLIDDVPTFYVDRAVMHGGELHHHQQNLRSFRPVAAIIRDIAAGKKLLPSEFTSKVSNWTYDEMVRDERQSTWGAICHMISPALLDEE